jgi:hypothetical protein
VLEAVLAAGAIAGGILVAAVMKKIGEVNTVAGGLLLLGGGALLMTPRLLPVVITGFVLLGAGIVWANVAAMTRGAGSVWRRRYGASRWPGSHGRRRTGRRDPAPSEIGAG